MSLFSELKKSKKVFDRTKKEKAPQGFTTSDEVIQIFKLAPGKGALVHAQISKISEGEINGDPVLKVNYVVISSPGKGTPLQDTLWFHPNDPEQLEEDLKTFFFMLQKLGYDTSGLSIDDIQQLVEELTEEKPYCKLWISCWKVKTGKNKGKLNVGFRVNSPLSEEDLNESSDDVASEDDEEDQEDEEEVDPEATDSNDDDEGEDSTDGDESDAEDESDEDSEDDNDEEEEGPDEDDPSTWIGYSVKCQPPRTKKPMAYEVIKYVKKSDTLIVKSKSGNEYKITSDKVIDWA